MTRGGRPQALESLSATLEDQSPKSLFLGRIKPISELDKKIVCATLDGWQEFAALKS